MHIRERIRKLRQRKANVRFRELQSLAVAAGWGLDRVSGSHYIFVKPGASRISIPNHPGPLTTMLVERVLDEIERDVAEGEVE